MTRSSYSIYETQYPYFITSSIIEWLPIFSHPQITRIILDSLVFQQENREMTLYGYVIIEDHIHLIAQSDDLQKNIRTFKSFTARKIIDLLKEQKNASYLRKLSVYKRSYHKDSDYQLWQEGYHPKQIVGHRMMLQKLDYMHKNPVKSGYVDRPEEWKYSSVNNYLDQDGIIPVTLYER